MADQSLSSKANPSDKKVLIVDDDEAIVTMMKIAFSVEGFDVATARDGRNILKKALEYSPDLIICDLMMPGDGGYEVLRSLQGDPATMKVPVLIMTGSSMAASTKSVMLQESNLAGYFEKPVRPETLIKETHKLLNTLSSQEARAQKREEPPNQLWEKF